MYSDGLGVTQNYSEAVKLISQSAEQGYPETQFKLGTMYGLGTGVSKNYVKAHMWISLAKAGGHKKADKGVFILEDNMTSKQIMETKQLAHEWIEQHKIK